MKLYRNATALDEYIQIQCLCCLKYYIFSYDDTPIYCPLCGVKYDGIFSKRNINHNIKYEQRMEEMRSCKKIEYPRLIIEYNPNKMGRKEDWFLYTQCRIGVMLENSSSSVYMFNTFDKLKKDGYNCRLIFQISENYSRTVQRYIK